MKTLIEITAHIDSRYYGAYLSATGWKQADIDNDPTHFAILDEIPESNGEYMCDLFEDGEEIEAVDTYNEVDTFDIVPYSGTGLGSYNGFRNLNDNNIMLISDLTGLIDETATTDGYRDIIFKVVEK